MSGPGNGSPASLSKKLRFSIFERDGFTCAYCGRKPPDVMLQVDHVIPRSRGGSGHPDNLVTSCCDCNSGKSAKLIDDPRPEHERLRAAQEKREREAMAEAEIAALQAETDSRQAIVNYLCDVFPEWDGSVDLRLVSRISNLSREFDIELVCEWIQIARDKFHNPSYTKVAKYVSGIARNVRAKWEAGE